MLLLWWTGVSDTEGVVFGMRSKSGKKIAVEGSQAPLGGMGKAFANLELPADLPEGPRDTPMSKPKLPSGRMGRVVLRREKARRGGKTVIVVDNFADYLTNEFIESIAKSLRSACGCGGTVRRRAIELQGNQPGKVRTYLESEGFTVGGVG